jgi:predicted nucleic acid-binding protein
VTLESVEEALPPGDLLLLDSTVIISYFKGNEAVSPVATYVVDRCVGAGRNPGIVSVLTAMELLVSPIRERDDQLQRQVTYFLLNTPGLWVADADFAIAQDAAALRATYNFKPPDALIIGTGRIAGARHLVTNDDEWNRKLGSVSDLEIAVCYLEDHLPLTEEHSDA